VRRRGVLERNNFVITRLHHRYAASGLPEDIEVGPAASVQGGVGVPTGPDAELPGEVEPAPENRLQTRFEAVHPSKKVSQCENPVRWRWGQPPAEYRGLRKTWTARDLAYKKRDKFVLKDVITSSVPALGITVAAPPAAPPAAAEATEKKDSGCVLAPSPEERSGLLGAGAALLLALVRRRSARAARPTRTGG
jgi:hypothetical protein